MDPIWILLRTLVSARVSLATARRQLTTISAACTRARSVMAVRTSCTIVTFLAPHRISLLLQRPRRSLQHRIFLRHPLHLKAMPNRTLFRPLPPRLGRSAPRLSQPPGLMELHKPRLPGRLGDLKLHIMLTRQWALGTAGGTSGISSTCSRWATATARSCVRTERLSSKTFRMRCQARSFSRCHCAT